MKRVADALWAVVRPHWWIRNYPASKALSDFIEARLDAGELPKIVDAYDMTLGGVTLWRANFPYAYGSQRGGPASTSLPARRVAMRLRRAELSVVGTLEDRIAASLANALEGAK